MQKAVISIIALAALAMTTALASTAAPGPVDIPACSVASRAELLLFAQAHPGVSHIEACKAAQ